MCRPRAGPHRNHAHPSRPTGDPGCRWAPAPGSGRRGAPPARAPIGTTRSPGVPDDLERVLRHHRAHGSQHQPRCPRNSASPRSSADGVAARRAAGTARAAPALGWWNRGARRRRRRPVCTDHEQASTVGHGRTCSRGRGTYGSPATEPGGRTLRGGDGRTACLREPEFVAAVSMGVPRTPTTRGDGTRRGNRTPPSSRRGPWCPTRRRSARWWPPTTPATCWPGPRRATLLVLGGNPLVDVVPGGGLTHCLRHTTAGIVPSPPPRPGPRPSRGSRHGARFPDHQHRARRVVQQGVTGGAQQPPGQRAPTVAADHDQ